MNLNKAIVAGHVTEAPQLRMTAGGQPVASMGVATNRTRTDKAGAKQEAVEFHSIVLWGRTAEIASQFLQKGSPVLIEGRIETRSWVDREKVTHYKTEIVCENLQLGQRAAAKEEKPEVSNSIFPPKKAVAEPKQTAAWEGAGRTSNVAREPYVGRMPDTQGPEFTPMFGEEENNINPSEIPF